MKIFEVQKIKIAEEKIWTNFLIFYSTLKNEKFYAIIVNENFLYAFYLISNNWYVIRYKAKFKKQIVTRHSDLNI